MRVLLAIVYMAFMLGANGALAQGAPDVGALRSGDMRKLILHDAPRPVPEAVFLDEAEQPQPLAQWRGRWVVLNFWATWCAPCREEMPSLDRLAVAMPELAVLPVAMGRNPVPGIKRFFDEAAVTHLPILRDPAAEFGRSMAVFGLPLTVILDPEGREVARLIGDAEWDSDSARAILAALIAGG